MGTGNPHQPLLSSLEFLKGDFSNPLWRKLRSQLQSRRKCVQMKNGRSGRRMPMKRRARLERPRTSIERKVRTLKKLVPNSESMGVEGLFRETADYIVALQMRVRVMQIMVDALSGSDDE